MMNNKTRVFAIPSVLPDGNDGFTPCPELTTEEKYFRFLFITANVTNYGGKININIRRTKMNKNETIL
ncbi:hypothetical protein ACFL1G_08875, partial [Planctomycetota bacterium]